MAPLGHVWRGLMGTLAMGLGFAGLAYLPLPEVTAIGYAAPLLVVVFAAMFLGENVRAFRLGMVALGLTGVLIVLSPRLTILSGEASGHREAFGAMLVLGGAVFAALAYERGEGALAQRALDRALADNPSYSLALLLRRVFTVGWPAKSFTKMRAELHPKVVATIFG